MNETKNPVALNSGVHEFQNPAQSASALTPYAAGDQNALPSQTVALLRSQSFIDDRLREALKPTIRDQGILKPHRYSAILKDTYTTLNRQIQNVKTKEAKEALVGLKALLEENARLRSLLNQYMNQIQKA